MSTGFVVSSIVEILMGVAVVYAVLCEDRLIAFEEKIAARFKESRQSKRALIVKPEDFSHCA